MLECFIIVWVMVLIHIGVYVIGTLYFDCNYETILKSLVVTNGVIAMWFWWVVLRSGLKIDIVITK